MNDLELEAGLRVTLTLDGHAGPAARISRDRASSMVEAAMLGFDGAAPLPAQRYELGRRVVMAAGMLLALVGSAAAARYYFHADEPQPARQERVPVRAPNRRPQAPAVVRAPAVVIEDAPDATPLTETGKPARSAPGERSAPEDLLQKANHLRAAGQFRQAAQTYTLVCDRFPKSLSAYVARVASASIELEHLSNPTRARRLFEQALREQPQAALDLEARQGLSVALRDLEDRPAEARALVALIAAHPDSPAARRAQVRLREIGGVSP